MVFKKKNFEITFFIFVYFEEYSGEIGKTYALQSTRIAKESRLLFKAQLKSLHNRKPFVLLLHQPHKAQHPNFTFFVILLLHKSLVVSISLLSFALGVVVSFFGFKTFPFPRKTFLAVEKSSEASFGISKKLLNRKATKMRNPRFFSPAFALNLIPKSKPRRFTERKTISSGSQNKKLSSLKMIS